MTEVSPSNREHGGNLDQAIALFGGEKQQWIDLSTGINPYPYPFSPPPSSSFNALPSHQEIARLEGCAKDYYQSANACLAVSGAQSALQLLAQYLDRQHDSVSILAPTYNEYERCFSQAGISAVEVSDITALRAADIAIVCTPNNPTGRHLDMAHIQQIAKSAKIVIVDESFADCADTPSIASQLPQENANIIVLKSFGKFFGLAGLRLGFMLGAVEHITALRALAGPWPVSGIAIDIAIQAFQDRIWQQKMRKDLSALAMQCDDIAQYAGWKLIGGCALFRLYETSDAAAAQHHLAARHIWSRPFSYHARWLRLGVPHHSHLSRLEDALKRAPS